ncbi:hypothetical protein KC571_02410 [candidate division WWE3 bacterium]|uniref:Uncharacterized protein n=1 Tax=candidate division WWE3 bacterium TaxID=2053526 RepID=A0A955LGX3_UNCKA|nr:hypothetical protein [candidate division WWE3 bacterium]
MSKPWFYLDGQEAICPDLDEKTFLEILEGTNRDRVIHAARIIPPKLRGRETNFRQVCAVWERVPIRMCLFNDRSTPMRINVWELGLTDPRVRVYRLKEEIQASHGTLLVPGLNVAGAIGVINVQEAERVRQVLDDGIVRFSRIHPLTGQISPLPAETFAENMEWMGLVSFYQLFDGWVARPEEYIE